MVTIAYVIYGQVRMTVNLKDDIKTSVKIMSHSHMTRGEEIYASENILVS